MNNDVKRFADDITNWLIDIEGLKQPQFQIYIYYKYTTYGSNILVLSYVDDYVFWYTYEEPGK